MNLARYKNASGPSGRNILRALPFGEHFLRFDIEFRRLQDVTPYRSAIDEKLRIAAES
jgi:hypothetical protein